MELCLSNLIYVFGFGWGGIDLGVKSKSCVLIFVMLVLY